MSFKTRASTSAPQIFAPTLSVSTCPASRSKNCNSWLSSQHPPAGSRCLPHPYLPCKKTSSVISSRRTIVRTKPLQSAHGLKFQDPHSRRTRHLAELHSPRRSLNSHHSCSWH